jgi:flagellar biogenesis protein FliO
MLPNNTGTIIIIAPSNTQTTQSATVLTRESPVNAGLVAGLIMVVLVLIVAGIVIAFLFLLKRSRKMNISGTHSKRLKNLLNPSYDYVEGKW